MNVIYINGVVYTVTQGVKEAFVVKDNRFIYVGSTEEALTYKQADSQIIDLDGKFVTAGFNDSHMHLLSTGCFSDTAKLDDAKSIDDLIDIGKKYIEDKGYEKGGWVLGFGWNQDLFDDEQVFPTRDDLDKISTERPVCFIRVCYHIFCCNSKGLELCGVDINTLQPDGGHIDMENGRVLGIFRDNATNIILSKIPNLSLEQTKEVLLTASKMCNSFGITSVQTDDLCESPDLHYSHVIRAFHELELEGKLSLRVSQQSRFYTIDDYKEFIQEGYKGRYNSNMFKIGPLKLIADGSLGARTALLNEPYNDEPDNIGIEVLSKDKLDEWVSFANENGMQVITHGIGDKAMYNIISSYEKVLDPNKPSLRYGIVHAQITDKNIINKLKELSIQVFVQSVFLDYDITIIENRIGKTRILDTYNYKKMLDIGINLANGSDSPVEPPDVMKGMQLAITRKSISYDSHEEFLINQGISIEEAIYSYTQAGAFASFEEDEKGSIEKGKLADFVVLDKNLLLANKNEIKDIKVLQTYLDGVLIYNSSS